MNHEILNGGKDGSDCAFAETQLIETESLLRHQALGTSDPPVTMSGAAPSTSAGDAVAARRGEVVFDGGTRVDLMITAKMAEVASANGPEEQKEPERQPEQQTIELQRARFLSRLRIVVGSPVANILINFLATNDQYPKANGFFTEHQIDASNSNWVTLVLGIIYFSISIMPIEDLYKLLLFVKDIDFEAGGGISVLRRQEPLAMAVRGKIKRRLLAEEIKDTREYRTIFSFVCGIGNDVCEALKSEDVPTAIKRFLLNSL